MSANDLTIHEKAPRGTQERTRCREQLAVDRLNEGMRVAQEMFDALAPHCRIFQPDHDLLRIQEDARDWLQRKYPEVNVPPVMGVVDGAKVIFPRLTELVAKLIGEQEGDPLNFLAPREF